MLLLPATLTAQEAMSTMRLLLQALKAEPAGDVIVDAATLQHFDSAALAVLLECRRSAMAWNKSFLLKNAPPKLVALARLYWVDTLLLNTG